MDDTLYIIYNRVNGSFINTDDDVVREFHTWDEVESFFRVNVNDFNNYYVYEINKIEVTAEVVVTKGE